MNHVGRMVKPEEIVVQEQYVGRAHKSFDPKLLNAIKHFLRNVRKFHRKQVPRS